VYVRKGHAGRVATAVPRGVHMRHAGAQDGIHHDEPVLCGAQTALSLSVDSLSFRWVGEGVVFRSTGTTAAAAAARPTDAPPLDTSSPLKTPSAFDASGRDQEVASNDLQQYKRKKRVSI
jgi:hypothetical protein